MASLVGMHLEPEETALDGAWDRLRAEERADRLKQVVQDTVRDARVADSLAGQDDRRQD